MTQAIRKRKARSPVPVRTQVLATALHLFTGHGYFHTTVHDIGREAHISIGAIYHHFQNKEEIARALFVELVKRMGSAFDAIEADHAGTHDRCRAIVALLFRITEEEPEVMTYMLHARHREFITGGNPVCSSKPFMQMRMMVKKGIETGEVQRMDPMVAASVLFGGPMRLIALRLDGLLANPLPNYLDEVWMAAWRAVAA